MVYFGIAKGPPDIVQAGGASVFLINILGKLKGEAAFSWAPSENGFSIKTCIQGALASVSSVFVNIGVRSAPLHARLRHGVRVRL